VTSIWTVLGRRTCRVHTSVVWLKKISNRNWMTQARMRDCCHSDPRPCEVMTELKTSKKFPTRIAIQPMTWDCRGTT
jgi:hypothetical protein